MNESYQIIALSLSSEQRRALQIIKGSMQIEKAKIDESACVILRELGLIRLEQEAGTEREFLELTQKGAHCAEFL